MSISIFNNSRVLSATEIVKETLSFIIDEKGNLAVSFATNKGKGPGRRSSLSNNFLNILML